MGGRVLWERREVVFYFCAELLISGLFCRFGLLGMVDLLGPFGIFNKLW